MDMNDNQKLGLEELHNRIEALIKEIADLEESIASCQQYKFINMHCPSDVRDANDEINHAKTNIRKKTEELQKLREKESLQILGPYEKIQAGR
jgi:chromosome segregation ATPase